VLLLLCSPGCNAAAAYSCLKIALQSGQLASMDRQAAVIKCCTSALGYRNQMILATRRRFEAKEILAGFGRDSREVQDK
jgi:hypothetical protein